ncbi:MAG: Holliday junction branch migration protein RuvA [Actinobacteria bacterium HGW-Actinobacteria-1]|nr:MAG: Holliday junction branch migration protein RuvA [Actinobacteria bacterium HGW-Actinobacteria-1]
MIAFLTGRIAEKGAGHVVLDVGGVGFHIAMSTGSLAALPAEGDSVTVRTHLQVREDELSLYGFENADEKALFEKLITVSGVGPRVALSALSSFRPSALIEAVAREDVTLLSSISGVGKKTAQRIIIELKDKLGVPDLAGAATGAAASMHAEARDALLSMGFSAAEVATALDKYDGAPDDSQALLKHALRRLGGGVS